MLFGEYGFLIILNFGLTVLLAWGTHLQMVAPGRLRVRPGGWLRDSFLRLPFGQTVRNLYKGEKEWSSLGRERKPDGVNGALVR